MLNIASLCDLINLHQQHKLALWKEFEWFIDINFGALCRDIQASSILLDDKYEVRLGSFSEVCASGCNNNQNMVARLLWTPQ